MIAAAVCKDPKIGSTEFEEPKDLRETKGTQVNFEKCWFLEFRIKSTICSIRNSRNLRNILSFMRNSRNQQFFRIYQGFYGFSKILWFLEFRTKKEKVQLLTITHFSFFLSCHFFSFVAVASASSCRTASPARRRAGKAVKNASFQVRVVGLGNDMLLQVM